MKPCHLVEIVTPKKVVLNGLWFGPKKARRVFVFVHGLSSSAFSMGGLRDALATKEDAVLVFNNRGFEILSGAKRLEKGGVPSWVPAGCAREIFTDCVDDIAGAFALAKKSGAKDIFLVGHSTGAQKIVYALSRKGAPRASGAILLGPLSDQAAARAAGARKAARRQSVLAKRRMASGHPHELLPPLEGFLPADAQRFLSLYTPGSPEDLFPYYDAARKPHGYSSLTLPVLALFAGEDEHADRPAEEIEAWFRKHSHSRHFASLIVPGVGHSFKGGEKRIASAVRRFTA